MEVIAKKTRAKPGIENIIAIILWTPVTGIMMVASVKCWMMPELDVGTIIGAMIATMVCVALYIWGIISYTRYYTTPEDILFYDGERIISQKGRFFPSEIKQVKYDLATWREGRRYGPIHCYPWGKLCLKVGKKKIKFYHVEHVKKVYNRLMELKRRAENSEI